MSKLHWWLLPHNDMPGILLILPNQPNTGRCISTVCKCLFQLSYQSMASLASPLASIEHDRQHRSGVHIAYIKHQWGTRSQLVICLGRLDELQGGSMPDTGQVRHTCGKTNSCPWNGPSIPYWSNIIISA